MDIVNKMNEILEPYYNFKNIDKKYQFIYFTKNNDILLSKEKREILFKKINNLNIGCIEYINENHIFITIKQLSLKTRLEELNELLLKVDDPDMFCAIQEEIMLLQYRLIKSLSYQK